MGFKYWMAALLSAAVMMGCSGPSDTIGFIGGLSGRVADLGVSGRDGAILALEDFNLAGGLDGHPLVLQVHDDQQDPERARRLVSDMVDQGLSAIIGPMTSSIAVSVAPLLQGGSTIMLSPTVSTNQLAGQADNFLRIYPQNDVMATRLGEYAYTELGLRHVAVVLDEGNLAHTKGWSDRFRDAFVALGGEADTVVGFASGPTVSFQAVVEQLHARQLDGVLVLANALDTAVICQQLRGLGVHPQIMVSEWSVTDDLLAYGKEAVEGVVFFNTVDFSDSNPAFSKFMSRFTERFGYRPGFASVHAYDATSFLLSALRRNRDLPAGEALLRFGAFNGLQGPIRLDQYGDVERDLFLMRVQGGRFVRVPRISHQVSAVTG